MAKPGHLDVGRTGIIRYFLSVNIEPTRQITITLNLRDQITTFATLVRVDSPASATHLDSFHAEPLEIDLARQVEYDMDEQDKEWLDAVNAERRKDQADRVTFETFEIIMDRLEKEWFDLVRGILISREAVLTF